MGRGGVSRHLLPSLWGLSGHLSQEHQCRCPAVALCSGRHLPRVFCVLLESRVGGQHAPSPLLSTLAPSHQGWTPTQWLLPLLCHLTVSPRTEEGLPVLPVHSGFLALQSAKTKKRGTVTSQQGEAEDTLGTASSPESSSPPNPVFGAELNI